MIPCSVEKWVSLVDKLSASQKFTFYETDLQGMLQMPSVKMREFLLHFLGCKACYNRPNKKFMVQESAGSKGLISIGHDDVLSIFGLKNQGVDVVGFLRTEGQ